MYVQLRFGFLRASMRLLYLLAFALTKTPIGNWCPFVFLPAWPRISCVDSDHFKGDDLKDRLLNSISSTQSMQCRARKLLPPAGYRC